MAHNVDTNEIRISGWLIPLLDVLFINGGFWFSHFIRYQLGWPYPVDPQFNAPFYPYIPYSLLLTGLCLVTYRLNDLYRASPPRNLLREAYRIFNGTTVSIVLVMAVTFVIQPLVYSRGMLILADFIIVLLLSTIRLGHRIVKAYLYSRGIGVIRVLVVGAGESGRAVMRGILASPRLGLQIAGYVDDDPAKGDGSIGRIKGLGGLDQLSGMIADQDIDEVIVTLPWMYHRKIIQIVDECERKNVRVLVVPDVFQQRMHHVDLETISGIPLLGVGIVQMSTGSRVIKRALEIMLCLLALPFLGIIFAITTLLITLDTPGSVFFVQRRVGKGGEVFEMYKFRSMIEGAEEMQDSLSGLNEADGPLFKIKDDPRITRVGKILRQSSIDELPQIINVLKGEMSLIGPRPGTPEEVERYEPWQRARLSVRPGMTGMWQISGRSDIPFEEMCLLDTYYIENWSLMLDIRIILQTIPHILLRRGAY
jgi:exopolysaccharide biosynthesis polyprenyl glycosylphosphotransferase